MKKLTKSRLVLYAIADYFILTAFVIFFFPHDFYQLTPGLSQMGPFNLHFIRDVSFVFLVSGAALAYGVYYCKKDVAVVAAMWPLLHALFHVQIWVHRGLPFDQIWAFDFVAVVLPAFIAFWLVLHIKPTTDNNS